jgi:PAS domain S-box-containing protein
MSQHQNIDILEQLFKPGVEDASLIKQMKQLFDLVEAFVAVIDTSRNILLINRKGKEILGYQEDELISKNFTKHLVPEKHRKRTDVFFENLMNGKLEHPGYHQIHLCKIDQGTCVVNVLYTLIPDSGKKILGALISGSDITDHDSKTHRLFKSKEKAEQFNKAKSEFLSSVSHEIRTPLNAIMGFTEQLRQTELDEQQSEFVKVIEKSSEHMLSLINDILVIQKIESSELSFEHLPFKIHYPVEYIYSVLKPKAEEKNLRFSYHISEKLNGMVLLGDAFRLRQILINLLSNAIKFTTQGYVELKCFIKSEKDDTVWVRFDVIDTGMGISPDKIDTIFEEFKQADSTITKRYGGTGLGLTICKKLIELQRGSLTVASQEGLGTTFTFSIPYQRGKETDIVPPDFGTIDSERLRNKRVLLADDDSVNRLLGKTILDKFNCHYDIANCGEEAIEKLKASAYDIILLDIHMPDVNGLEVAKFLRRMKGDEATKIIAVTAAFMQHDLKEFYEHGINDFLIKPFKEVNLFNKMCEVLEIKTVSKERQKAEIILEEYHHPKSYNLEELEKMAGQDKEFISQMLLTFIGNTESTIILLSKLLKEKDWEQIGETAHKILPSYRHLEVENIVSKLVELKDKTITQPDYKAVPSLVRSTMDEMKALVSELKQEINKSI